MKYPISLLVLLAVPLVIEANTPVQCTPHITQMKNPDNPYTFYKCDASGTPILFECPAGTRFDENLELCNWDNDTLTGRIGVYGGDKNARTGSGANGHGINTATTVGDNSDTNQAGTDCSTTDLDDELSLIESD